MELLTFIKWNSKLNLEHKTLLFGATNVLIFLMFFLRKIYPKVDQIRNTLEIALVPKNVNKMHTSTCFMPSTYHNWENMETIKNNF